MKKQTKHKCKSAVYADLGIVGGLNVFDMIDAAHDVISTMQRDACYDASTSFGIILYDKKQPKGARTGFQLFVRGRKWCEKKAAKDKLSGGLIEE